MATRFRNHELLGGENLRAAFAPLLEQDGSATCDDARADLDGLSAARDEARLILQIVDYVEALGSTEEIRATFSHSALEAHLTDALLAGGAAGELDMPRLLQALQAATAAGSVWAPQWLVEVESLRSLTMGEMNAEEGDASTRRLAQLSELAAEMARSAADTQEVESMPLQELQGSNSLAIDMEEEPEIPPRLRRMIDGLRAISEAAGDSQEQQEKDVVNMFKFKPRKSKL
mmetsp:Transcript_20442/g.36684  ORF Transcript_20442/g.36684 Transcript_20442/m.36684 type:complete len:231 (+) Transcript_20442:23-715(+)|eukprot:CAMPEP_0197697308 /NCGR_PEP_ID=MMETSP1338-20131121/117802_1 /TAXON_ID=43686 ORGANISM="Pelagodinium beii, Strain RCC1491" /NCGR_SAMPLE_ID=MMETSP1338 /ASSEMBLY_ACC=CAM_ASM_000754 /LENGTH=230 /DNA_ID=CAMNT_0043280553 /DNA_START=22 /DNA_END=714 /DNA_ORIENTATION=-